MWTLGTTARRRAVVLSDEERSRHLHLIGASGTGKSKLMQSMLQQDLLARRGFCLIDPHGTLADDLIAWSTAMGMSDFQRIHVIEPAADDWVFGFNPLRNDGVTERHVRVNAMVAACAQVWGGEDPSKTPLLKKCLQATFHVLSSRDLTLVEAPYLTSLDAREIRRALTNDLDDDYFRRTWSDLGRLASKEFFEQFASTNNRLMEFLGSPSVRRILGQREGSLDLRQVMDAGEAVIVNLRTSGRVSADNARLLGTLLTSEFLLLALSRDPAKAQSHPFTLYIDECYDYLTSDIGRMLDQTRKFGLHLVLAHQHLGQLRERSEAIYSAIMTGGQNKVVFGGLSDDDADIFAHEIMRNSIDLERPKHVLDKPIVVDEVPFWLDSYSETTGSSSTEGWAESSSWGSTATESAGSSENYNSGEEITGTGLSSLTSSSHSFGGASSSSRSNTETRSSTWGRSQTLKPIRQTMATAVYSLEEQMHLAILKLRELPNGSAIVKRRGKVPVRIKTLHRKPALAPQEQVGRFIQRSFETSPYVHSRTEADGQIAKRAAELESLAKAPKAEEGAFWTDED